MPQGHGLLGKLSRAFWLQALAITVAVLLGMLAARFVIEDILLRNAVLGEADYYWAQRALDPDIALPDTRNLTGYRDVRQLPEKLRGRLPQSPGFYEFDDLEDPVVLHYSRNGGEDLYLVFYRGQVDSLVLYFGLLPLLLLLSLLYLSLWIAYRVSHRSLSPVARLGQRINQADLDGEEISLQLEIDADGADDEIRILSDALNSLGERLNTHITRERLFTRDVSHELRTPLTVIGMAADMMLIDNKVDADSRQTLERVKRAVTDMQELVEVFLMLARERGRDITREPVDVNRIARDLVEQADWLNGKPGVRLSLIELADLRLQSSHTVISVLLNNLLQNALRYSAEGNIRVLVGKDRIVVSDDGPGIEPELVEHLFKPYTRGEMAEAGGFGVGLNIVKRLCDSFGWQIRLADPAVGGASFELLFTDAASDDASTEALALNA